mmetsp:Transcript_36147/g.93877  ORF Transcript_36147/g.93877 Transcript_36147/m.93877 type:complete len:149 (+) Transcript_36147:56-502(+)
MSLHKGKRKLSAGSQLLSSLARMLPRFRRHPRDDSHLSTTSGAVEFHSLEAPHSRSDDGGESLTRFHHFLDHNSSIDGVNTTASTQTTHGMSLQDYARAKSELVAECNAAILSGAAGNEHVVWMKFTKRLRTLTPISMQSSNDLTPYM